MSQWLLENLTDDLDKVKDHTVSVSQTNNEVTPVVQHETAWRYGHLWRLYPLCVSVYVLYTTDSGGCAFSAQTRPNICNRGR
jgi:hypothetical protein